jgi:hypothetical protein
MFITERKLDIFKFVNVLFAEEPVTINIPDWDVMIYHTNKNWGDIEGFERLQYPSTTIDLSQDIEVIWKRISRQHKRHILRAEKNGTMVTMSNNYEKFHQIHKSFLKRKNYTDIFGLKFFLQNSCKSMGSCLLLKIKMKHWEEIYIFMIRTTHF